VIQDKEKTDDYKSTVPIIFPKLSCKFKGSHWNVEVARSNLKNIMSVLGFGHGGSKQYKIITDKPDGWPSSIDFSTVKHPSYLTLSQTNTIIESLLGHHSIDPYNFFNEDEDQRQPPKAKRARKANSTVISPLINDTEEVDASGEPTDNASSEPTVDFFAPVVQNSFLEELDFELY